MGRAGRPGSSGDADPAGADADVRARDPRQEPLQRAGEVLLRRHLAVPAGQEVQRACPRGPRRARRRPRGVLGPAAPAAQSHRPRPRVRRPGLRERRAPLRRAGVAGQRAALPLPRAARLGPHRRHRRGREDDVRQSGGRGHPRLPGGRVGRWDAARPCARRGPGPDRTAARRPRRAAVRRAHRRAADGHPRRPGAHHGGRLPQPARRPGGPRHRVERPRRDRSACPAGPAQPRRVPRLAHRPAEPGAVHAPAERGAAGGAGLGRRGRGSHRPRRLQERQRRARPSGRRRAAAAGRREAAGVHPGGGHGRPPGRRRVRDRRPRRDRRAGRRRQPPGPHRLEAADQRPRPGGTCRREHRCRPAVRTPDGR